MFHFDYEKDLVLKRDLFSIISKYFKSSFHSYVLLPKTSNKINLR